MDRRTCIFRFVKKIFKVVSVRPLALKKFPGLATACTQQCCGKTMEAGRYFGLYKCKTCGRSVEELEEKLEDVVVFRCAQCGAEKKFIIDR